MRKTDFLLLLVAAVLLAGTSALAATYDFEDGTDAMSVTTSIEGLIFAPTLGRPWIYGDWRTGKYDGPYPAGPYYSEGNFFAWLDTEANTGRINFTQGASRFALGYSSPDLITLEGYNALNVLIDSETGDPNLNTGELGLLTVESDALAYIIIGVGSMGNYWLIDNIDTDAIPGCLIDADCDDGVFCNGVEKCVDKECLPEESPDPCPEDGIYCNGEEYCNTETDACKHRNAPECGPDGFFCNGDEFCDEEKETCGHKGNPCKEGETCNEELDLCTLQGTDDDTETPVHEDTPGWPEGEVTGGCCGCG